MPVHPRHLPKLSWLLALSDWHEVRKAFQASVGLNPDLVGARNATIPEQAYALLFHAYSHQHLDGFLSEIGQRLAPLGAAIASETSPGKQCPTQAVSVGQLPLMDRDTLRQLLPDLVTNYRILTIEGDPATGKSYSAHLIKHVGVQLAAADVYIVPIANLLQVKLVSGGSPEYEPYELAEYIGDKLGLSLRPELRTAKAQDARIVHKLLNWFLANFPQRRNPATPFWLVLDDLNFAACPAWIHDFALGLAELTLHLDDLRLFLIGFNQDKLTGDSWLWSTQDVHTALTQDDVWNFIVKAAAERAKPVDPSERPRALQRVWGGYSAPLRHEEAREVARKAALLVRSL